MIHKYIKIILIYLIFKKLFTFKDILTAYMVLYNLRYFQLNKNYFKNIYELFSQMLMLW